MNLSKFSKDRLKDSFEYWNVDAEYYEPMTNYLLYGFSPGSFFFYVLCNDWANAIIRSHPANQVENLKTLTKWIINVMPKEAWGHHEVVDTWLTMMPEQRRQILERHDLILTEKEETWMALNERSSEYF